MSEPWMESAWAANPDNACAANGVTADGKPYHYSAAHNGYVYDEPDSTKENTMSTETIQAETAEVTQAETAEVTQPAEVTETARSFYRSDYARMARTIQRMRHVQGDRYTPKAYQSAVDSLAVAAAQEFALDAKWHPHGPAFDAERFLAGTRLPARPGFAPAEDAHLEAAYEDLAGE